MSNNKMFTIAGTSFHKGENTFRFATGKVAVRTAKLTRGGHTDVGLIELPEPMTKEDAIAFLVAQGRSAVKPAVGRGKKVELTPEQVAEAEAAAKKAAFVARMAEARTAKKAAEVAEADAAFLSGITGTEIAAAEMLDTVNAELGVDGERAAAVSEDAVEG